MTAGGLVRAVPTGAVRGWLSQRRTMATLLALALLWQLASLFVPEFLAPGWQVLVPRLVEALGQVTTYETALVTMVRIAVSLVAAVVLGTILGGTMGVSQVADAYLTPFLRLVMGIPALTWILVAVIWFRNAELRIFFVIVAISLPILAISTRDGIRALPHDLDVMVRSLRPTTWQRVRILVAPHALPYVLSGTRVALSFATRLVVFAELIAATTGIGAAMYADYATFDIAGIFVWTLLLVVMLYALDALLGVADRRLLVWRPHARDDTSN